MAWITGVFYRMVPPSDVSGFINPIILTIVTSAINHSYGSYKRTYLANELGHHLVGNPHEFLHVPSYVAPLFVAIHPPGHRVLHGTTVPSPMAG